MPEPGRNTWDLETGTYIAQMADIESKIQLLYGQQKKLLQQYELANNKNRNYCSVRLPIFEGDIMK